VSNDNAYAETLFRTAKYCPLWPQKPFDTLVAARAWVQRFAQWYNEEHRHSGIRYVTPARRVRIVVVSADFVKEQVGGRMRARSGTVFS
jgi:transposase InsO family protein